MDNLRRWSRSAVNRVTTLTYWARATGIPSVSSLPPRVEHLEPGSRLGRYEMLCPVARGGMASVWLARLHGPHGFEKLVAIKTILPQYACDPRFEQMFLDEARIASRIEHANVARVLDLGEDNGTLFLVMEWVDGEALSKIQRSLERRGVRWPLGVALRLIADVCGGLHAAHELHAPDGRALCVVHRDVSPQNILVTSHGVAKVIDFGIAKALGRLCEDTSAGSIKGKLQYMPPEQALGQPIDRAADIWAAGATLYYLLTGKPPHDAEVPLETVQKLTNGVAPAPLPADVPASVVALVHRAMSHEPVDRFATAQEMQQELEELMRREQLVTSAMDIESFLRRHLADRIENRRRAVDLAFGASVDREHIQRLLFPTGDHSTGVLVGGAYLKVLGPSSSTPPPSVSQCSSTPVGQKGWSGAPDSVRPPRSESRTATAAAAAAQPIDALGPPDLEWNDSVPSEPIQVEFGSRRSCDPRELARLLDVEPTRVAEVIPVGVDREGRHPPSSGRRRERLFPGEPAHGVRRGQRFDHPNTLTAMLAVMLVLSGALALEATSHGAFMRHDLAQWLRQSDSVALRARAEASTLLGFDGRDAGQAALAVLDAALERSPHDDALRAFTAHVTFAVELRFGRDPQRHARALGMLSEARATPLRALAAGTLAILETRPEARSLLTQALGGEGAHEARHMLAEIALNEGQRDELELHLGAIEGYSHRLEFLRVRALVATDPAAARTRAEALAAKAPVHAAVRLLLARLAWEVERDQARATQWAEQVLALPQTLSSPRERAEAEALRGKLWLARGLRHEARSAFQRAADAVDGPPPIDVELGLGELALADGQPAKALNHFRAVLSVAPRHAPAQLGLARGQMELGLFNEARGVLEPLTHDPTVGEEAATLRALASMNDSRL